MDGDRPPSRIDWSRHVDPAGQPLFRHVTEGDVLLVRMAHVHLKFAQAQELSDALDEADLAGYRRVVFNLDGVEYIDSSGISVLVRLAAERQLRLCCLGAAVEAVLRKMNMHDLFAVFETERAAMDSFAG